MSYKLKPLDMWEIKDTKEWIEDFILDHPGSSKSDFDKLIVKGFYLNSYSYCTFCDLSPRFGSRINDVIQFWKKQSTDNITAKLNLIIDLDRKMLETIEINYQTKFENLTLKEEKLQQPKVSVFNKREHDLDEKVVGDDYYDNNNNNSSKKKKTNISPIDQDLKFEKPLLFKDYKFNK
ncbi:hypothetical protein PPL_01265 [Heterostelium album PN500]|uniref:Uncharacterized protein n=1 Tax=Heterostelium pallidum (strain ATCC 26659 / Pp 5 / PN500) TaxID=670386 RepID=D3AYK5_HETP5|nr:hypothetical protein PPL_01265 [Heterostelium album PN500]EFA86032.1 hypothetical protein PPL_01265 [Heterostelium album PN500]|eukprot:XP_020438138.1 hypothetical protein PPL_01265 [Heterostelium album PN500]